MGKVPEGLQDHYLFEMDGRSWLENAPSNEGSRSLSYLLERGHARKVPRKALLELVRATRDDQSQ
jgi:hypothetical protein